MCWVCYQVIMSVLVFKLLCVLMQSKVFSMMNTVFLETEDCEVEPVKPACVPGRY